MLKIISLNIEGSRHLESRILPFLQQEQPDVICLQEVYKTDLPLFEKIGLTGHFQPMANIDKLAPFWPEARGEMGLFLGVKLPLKIKNHKFELYSGEAGKIPNFSEHQGHNFWNRYLGWIQLEIDGETSLNPEVFTIATTHFTYAVGGQVTSLQRQDFAKLLRLAKKLPPHLLMGDFNTPRGKELWSQLTQEHGYQDHTPPTAKTTIDNDLHRAENEINFVVDGFFSQLEESPYQVSAVKLVSGVSDHQAVVGLVEVKD